MRHYSLQDIADELAVSCRTVDWWIDTGELKAVDVSRNRTSRKRRLRVTESDLQEFLAGRTVGAEKPLTRRRPRKRSTKQYV